MVLYPSRAKAILLLLVSLAFVVSMIVSHGIERGIAGSFVVLFFGLCAIVFIIQLIPGASHLKLSEDGFSVRALFRKSKSYSWSNVSDFRAVTASPGRKIVVFDSLGNSTTLRKMNRAVVGATDGLPDTYGMKAEELADLMNSCRSRALRQ